MDWQADWLGCSASKNSRRASFLILSQSLCVSSSNWCMSGLQKSIKSAFEVQTFFIRRQLNISTWILIGIWIWSRWTIFVGIMLQSRDHLDRFSKRMCFSSSTGITHILYTHWRAAFSSESKTTPSKKKDTIVSSFSLSLLFEQCVHSSPFLALRLFFLTTVLPTCTHAALCKPGCCKVSGPPQGMCKQLQCQLWVHVIITAKLKAPGILCSRDSVFDLSY